MTQKILELLPILIFDTDLSLVNIITQTLPVQSPWRTKNVISSESPTVPRKVAGSHQGVRFTIFP